MSAMESITHEENRTPVRCLVVGGGERAFLGAQLRRMLERRGFSVLTAAGDREALRLCWRTMPRAVFLPLRRRGRACRETAELLRRLRQMPHAENCAVIVCVGEAGPEEISRMILEGATDCITQPISPDLLDAKLMQAGVQPAPEL